MGMGSGGEKIPHKELVDPEVRAQPILTQGCETQADYDGPTCLSEAKPPLHKRE